MNKDNKKDETVHKIKINVIGGELPGPALSTKAGSLGIPVKKVAEDIKKATAAYAGNKVFVHLEVCAGQTKIDVVPSVSTMIIKSLKEPPRDRKKVKNILHSGNLTLTEVLEIARQARNRSYSKTLAGTVKEVLGTCRSVGCTVEGVTPAEVTRRINAGETKIPEK